MIKPTQSVPGNFGFYRTETPQITIDEKRGILVAGNAVSEASNAGRGFFVGYDITQTPPKLLWRQFILPPQNGSDPNWAINSVNSMDHAYIFNGTSAIDLKALPQSQLHDMLYADWGNFGYNGTVSFAGLGTGWGGSWAYDPSTGLAYVATAQPAADWNASTRPGPNLWADAIMAVDEATGKFVWGFQTSAHDTWDWDCSWSVMLANVTINSQVTKAVYKGCKNGYMYALNAATGAMLWYFNPPSIKRGPYSYLYDPRNKQEMTLPWQNYPSTKPIIQNPCGTGGIESDPAYDPTTNMVFVAPYNCPTLSYIIPIKGPGIPYGGSGLDGTKSVLQGNDNTTIYALNAATGLTVWSYFIPNVGFRGGVTVSNGVLYVPSQDGNIYMLNEQTGQLLSKKFIGAAMITQPAIAPDANGDVKLVMPAATTASPAGVTIGCGLTTPGFMFALYLPQVSGQVTTVQSTTTVQGPSTGVDVTTYYASVGVAVIFIITTGILLVRRRKPAA